MSNDIQTPHVAASDTSTAMATEADKNGTTRDTRRQLLERLEQAGTAGFTWAELANVTEYHHGQISGCLNTLHSMGKVVQLKEVRNRCHPYTLAKFAKDYEPEQYNTDPVKTGTSALRVALEEVERLARVICYTQVNGNTYNELRAALSTVQEIRGI